MYDSQCSGTVESPHPQFFRFIQDSQLSPPLHAQQPRHSIDLQLPLAIRTSRPPLIGEVQGRCAVSGCAKRRVNIKCIRGACATHCRALGGCSVNLHQSEGAMSMPSSSQSFEPAYVLPQSQPPLATFPMTMPTFSPLHMTASLPPVPVPVFIPTAGPQASIDQPVFTPNEQPSVHLPSPVHPVEAPPIPPISYPSPARILTEPPSSMNPLPNPRFASQMRPIFTDQSKREQELQENTRVVEEQRLAAIKKVKHTVTVCAWLSVSFPIDVALSIIHLLEG